MIPSANPAARPLCAALLFGGLSSEHEVSRVSAVTFAEHMDPERYELIKIGITKEGRWLYTEATSAQMADGSWEQLPGNMPCVLSPDRADHGAILFTPSGHVEKLHIDVVLPVLHGLWGEDGTIQGLLELAGIPYVGCGVLASAVCMDKAVANALFACHGIPHCAWAAYTRAQLEADPAGIAAHLAETLGWPIFVKPANAGSSVGVTKAGSPDELARAIQVALENDRKVVFESFVDGQEVECAVIGSEPAAATRPGRSWPAPSSTPTTTSTRTASARPSSPPACPKKSWTRSRAGRPGLHRSGLRGAGPLRLLRGAGHRPGPHQRDQHHARLHLHQHVPQADGARRHPLPQLIDRLIALAMERPVARHG